jgi:hypothetical protein
MTIDPAFVLGIVLLATGWIALPFALRAIGLVAGATLGVLLVDLSVLVFPEFRPPLWAYLGAAVLLGLIGLFMAMKLFRLLLFLSGFVAALVLKIRLDDIYDFSGQITGGFWGDFPLTVWFTLAVALVGGLLLSLLQRYLIVVLTAMAGAALVVRGTTLDEKWFTIAAVGSAFQVLCVSSFSRRRKRK